MENAVNSERPPDHDEVEKRDPKDQEVKPSHVHTHPPSATRLGRP
jgi:hypothetical protein